VTAKIVHDDDIARYERRHEDLLDISQEACAVDRPIDNARCIDPIGTQRRQESERSPTAKGRFGEETLTLGAASVAPRHVGLGPSLVDEDKPRRIEFMLMRLPALTPPFDVGAILFGCVQAFF